MGFGGWLLLLALGQTVSPLRTLGEFSASIEGYKQLMTLPNGPLTTYGEVALLLAFLVLQLVVTIAMFRRSPRFKQLFLLQWIAIPVVFVVDVVWVSALLKLPVSQVLAGDALVKPIGLPISTTPSGSETRSTGLRQARRSRLSFSRSGSFRFFVAVGSARSPKLRWTPLRYRSQGGLPAEARRAKAGAPGRNRTADLRFTKPLLYQLSYKGTALRLAYFVRQ